jgi:hypothetical protein
LNFEEERGIDLSYVRISFIASLRFSDVWPGHGSVPISNATVIVENSAPNWVEILGIAPDAQEPGLYNIKFKCIEAFLDQSVSLTITFEKDNYVTQTLLVEIRYDYNIILPPPEPWWWPLARLALLVSFAFAIYHHRRNSQKTDSASAIDDASNYPVPSPHTLEEQGNQDSSAGWYCIYFILAIWIWFNLFRGGMLIQFGALIILTVAAYYYRRIDRRIESASTLVGDSVTPAPAPDTPEEHGNQLSSADWFCIYFILGTWIWFSLFSSGWIQFGAPIILTVAAYYYRRIDRRTESASTLVGDSNTHALSPDTLEDHGNQNSRTESASTLVGDSVTPAPSPDTLEEHGNQDSSACRYSIYFILVMLFGIGWFLFRP